MNDNFSNEIKRKKNALNESLKDLDKKYDIFLGIGRIEDSSIIKIPKLNNELLNANKTFIEQLDLFDEIISDILCAKFNGKMANNLELMKQCINSDICSRGDVVEKIEKINPEKVDDYISLKLFRLIKIHDFLKNQKEKIIQAYKSLYEESEKYFKEINDKSQTLKNLVDKKLKFENELLFKKWKESGPKINHKYCKIRFLRKNFIDLIKTIELDKSFTYDEEFTLWLIKNNFDIYL